MFKKYVVVIIIILVVGLGLYFWSQKTPLSSPETTNPQNQESANQQTAKTPAAEKNIVTYTDSGFSPTPLEIKIGSTVVFKNNSSEPMWVASAMHPTHTIYPTKGGCIGSTFDECQGIAPGGSWSFKFDILGSWNYHNHMNAKRFGIIVVK